MYSFVEAQEVIAEKSKCVSKIGVKGLTIDDGLSPKIHYSLGGIK